MIKDVINEWDPLNLFPYAPDNEYENEILLIEKFIQLNEVNVENITEVIILVFTKSFGNDLFKHKKIECHFIAKKIMKKLINNNYSDL